MVSLQTQDVARRAEALYAERLRDQLEQSHRGFFVAIEPDSGDYFLGRTLEEASAAARRAHPDRLPYALRVGFPAVFEIGHAL